ESIVVSKNATPDMNANFAGGYVEIRTKAIPKNNFTSFSIGTSYNSISTFNERLTKKEGAYDYLGFDDGSKSYPSGLAVLPIPTKESESGAFIEQSKLFKNDNFTTYKTYAAPGTSLQFALGRAYDISDKARWGFVGSLLFKNTQDQLKIEHSERGWRPNNYYKPATGTLKYGTLEQYGFKNSGASYSFNSTLGGMFNTGLQIGKSKITLRNIWMHIYNSQLTQTTGWNNEPAISDILNGNELPYTQETSYPVYQTFLQNKIEGDHKLGDFEINWYAAYGTTSKDTKDATFINRGRIKVGEDIFESYGVYNSQIAGFRRANFTNDEKNYNAAVNFKYDFNIGASIQNSIKGGYFGTYKKATNQQGSEGLVVVGQGTKNSAVIDIPLSDLLDGSHYNWGGFGWLRTTTYGNEYIGDVKIHSPFLMVDNKISSLVRLVWGMRAESYIYTQIASQADNAGSFETVQRDESIWQYLPSANLTISPTNKMNVRLGYNKSVLRPQFAERLNMPYYDPIRKAIVLNYTQGIVSSVVNNYDFKLEWFPTRGEILSCGIYSKNIENPIEAVNAANGGARYIYNMNSKSAKLIGVEMEIYKNLSFLGEGDALERIFFYGNAAFNNTKVTGYKQIDG
ncbi:TonB-dependent receptor, partial [Flavobacterium sp.]|uniref:TonB-dependent receptor n=1 Tax=Flavobacterium sp. TaxID=239 RepID=UPI003C4B189E